MADVKEHSGVRSGPITAHPSCIEKLIMGNIHRPGLVLTFEEMRVQHKKFEVSPYPCACARHSSGVTNELGCGGALECDAVVSTIVSQGEATLPRAWPAGRGARRNI
ncbi:hypothetical protein RRG08_059879 [Elysia crispata]|uniref:Uncharacterized protein n=1 Tax=Elysia crispata TaxID=231223 RepID=A0AAE0ZGZ7_9GAST|nr:hypothetical protein RRG08_059879 [Elysia crispata]